MSGCEVLYDMALDGPPYLAGGAVRAVARCHIHGQRGFLPWSTGCSDNAELFCPVGQVEYAVEVGLAKIKEAQSVGAKQEISQ